jgi:hypothetical protein
MRNELEIIAQIERYLAGQLSDADKKAFETELAKDPQLRENLSLQRDILAAIDRITAQTAIRRARTHWLRARYLTQWGGLALGLVIAAVLFLLFMHHTNPGAAHNPSTSNVSSIPSGPPSYTGDSLPPVNESGEHRWAAADSNITAQIFWVNASTDTVIETKGGILFSVAAGSFLDRSGAAIKGTIELIVKEALDPATIIKAGLSTRSSQGEQSLLETGGMFFLDARKNGQAVSINPNRAIYAQIPTDSVRARMELFTGRRIADGTIDWVKPQPLNHDLIPIDINLLNFYPPHYLDSVAKWGYNGGDKKFTDSLYYSFARFFAESDSLDSVKIGSVNQEGPVQDSSKIGRTDTIITARDASKPKKDYLPTPKSDSTSTYCGINPAKIKAIWNTAFQNTLISTRAFEKRLVLIHQSCDNNLLDLYVNHLDKDLCSIDSLAAAASTGKTRQQFLRFAAHKDGKVKNGVIQLDLLRNYYQNKAKAFMEAITKTQNDFWNEQTRLDDLAAAKQFTHLGDSIKRITQNIDEEFRLNLKSGYAQLGYDTTFTRRTPPTNTYTAQIITAGWCNVDRYVEEATITRQSMAYTDRNTGKKAVLTYQSVSFQFQREQQYSRIYVYLLPDKLSSFMRLSDSMGKFTERINKLMTYRLICIAYKEEQAFFYSQSSIQSKDYADIILTGISNIDLNQKLNELGSRTQANDLQQETGYFQFEIRDQKRQRRNGDLRQLTQKMINAFFSCSIFTGQGFPQGQEDNEAQPVQVAQPTR